MAHQTQGNTFTSLLKDMIKDPDEQPDEENRVKSESGLRAAASVPMELGCVTLQVDVCSPTWQFSQCHTRGFTKIPHIGTVN